MIKADNTEKRCFIACSEEKKKSGQCSCINNFTDIKQFVSRSCKGEICSVCGKDATNKLGEEIPFDDPDKNRHNLTAYVCREHFTMIVGGCH